jgi:phospholipase C/sugar lactone lactonase YvrE
MTLAMNGDAIEFSQSKQSNAAKVLRAFRGIVPFLYPAFGSLLENRKLFLFAKPARDESLTDLRTRLRILAFFFVLIFSTSIPTTVFANTESKTSVPSLPARPIARGTVKLQSTQNGFGAVAVGTAAPLQTLSYQFSSTTTLSAVDILTIGAPGLDYSDGGSSTCAVGTQYTAGSSCTVNVAFTPTAPGMRAGAVTLYMQGSNLPLVTWYLNGVGQSGSVTIDPGTQSKLGSMSGGAPYGSTVDGAGNVYVVDNAGGQVIELAANTFAQSTVLTGLSGPTTAAIDGAGNLYVSDTQNNRVVMIPNENGTLNGTDMIVLSISGLGSPYGIAVDGNGNLYVADVTNADVLEVPAGGGTPTIVVQGLTSPLGIAVDFAGNVYVAANNSVTEYPSGGGTAVPLGGGYNNPSGLAVDAAGNVYLADTGNGRIVEVAAGGASQSIFPITGLTAPQSVSLDAADNLYVTDGGSVYEVNRTQAAALVFSPTSVGSTSAVQTLTVSDNGNQALTMTSMAVAANFMQEPSGGADCSSSTNLSSGGQCLIAVAFTPMQSGPSTGTLTVADNALNNTASMQVVQLSGTGLQLAQTITFSTNAPASAVYNSNFTVAAIASSSLPVVYSSAGACTNSGATYTVTSGIGTCSVVANQSGNNNYIAALQVTQTVSATPATQTIAFSASAPANASYNSNFTVVATASSNLPVVYTSAGACTNSGATYTMTSGTGTCSVISNQSGNSNYSPAVPVTLSTSATLVTQTITFISNAPTNAAYNSTFTIMTTASSNLPVVYTSAGACTNSGATYTITIGSGTCTVIANQPGNNNYSAAPQVTQTVNTLAVTQAITFVTNALANAAYNSNFTVSATANSSLPVVYTSAGACTNSGAIYTITGGSGTCAVIANQPGNSNYSAAPQVTQSTSAAPAAQTITFAAKAPTSSGYNSNFTVSANASSGLASIYSSSGVCSNSGATYTITASSGTCTVTANQPGNTNFMAAPTITESTIASKGTPTTTFTGAEATAPYQSSFTVAATTNASTKAVITASGSCSVSSTTVTMTSGSGTCAVTANWAADSQYLAATASQTTTAQKLASNLTWPTPAAITYGTALTSTQLNAKATYGSTTLTGAFVYSPANSNVPAAGNNTLSVVFTPTNSTNYTGATGSVTLLVNKASTTTKITSVSPSTPIAGQSVQVNLSVTAGYGKPTQSVTVNSTTGESCSATLSNGIGNCSLIFSTTGSRTLTATYSGDNNDLASSSAGFALSVGVTGNFSLSMSPSAFSLSTGATSPSITLSVTGQNGLQGSVTFTVSGLPAGVTISQQTPFSVAVGGKQSLNLSASTATKPGSYSVSLQGTCGSVTHSIALNLTISAMADFSLLISPSGLSVMPGAASTPLVASVGAIGGFSGTVSIGVAGLPSGVTTTPSGPFSLAAGGNQQMTVNVPGSVANGSYPIVLTGTSGTLTHTVNFMLTVSATTFAQTFQHVVVIVQENRTPDNLFQGLPNADIATSGINSLGQGIPLAPIDLANNYDLDHSHHGFETMYDNGAMDGADKVTITCAGGATNCPPPNAQFMYVNPSEVQPYFQLAEAYTFGDRMFQTNQGPSLPAHQFIISGTSAPTATSVLFAAENPSSNGSGCNSPAGATVALIDPLGNENQLIFPCFEHSTLMDLLDAQTISWRYYSPMIGTIWNAPNAIQHIYSGPDWANVIIPQTQVLNDIANGQLPNVSWVIPDGGDSDHPSGNLGTGPSWVAAVVNAIGNSQYWGNTAIIITWDDWGGWYDHVAPPIYNSYEYGFRVPLIVVSPYAKQGYVSHVTHDFGSILKFTEEVFNLPSLGYADSRADDLSDCFDLLQTPISFQTVPADVKQDFFLNTKRAPTPPDVD